MDEKRQKREAYISPKQMGFRVACVVLALLLLVLGIYYAGRTLETGGRDVERRGELSQMVAEGNVVRYHEQAYRLKERLTTILMMGIDTSETQHVSGGFRNGGQSDFLLLLVIDEEQKTITPLQIDRDTMAEITILGVLGNVAGTKEYQICLSHGFGDGKEQSCQFTVDAVSKLLLGTKIDFYVAMNLDGIPVLNDALGGVTVTLEDDFTALDPTMTQGTTLTLMGKQAEYFVRNRMNIGVGTNESRVVRQKQYLKRLGELLDGKIRERMSFAGDLFDLLSPHMQTDMRRGRMINEAWSTRDYLRKEIVNPTGEYVDGTNGFVEFHIDQEKLESLVMSLFYEPV